jgi:hypothetical protein
MSDIPLLREILSQILEGIRRIERRFAGIATDSAIGMTHLAKIRAFWWKIQIIESVVHALKSSGI